MQTVFIELRSVYGKWQAYPVGDLAQGLADIAGTKTITPQTLRVAKRLGLAVMVESGGSGRAAEILDSIEPRLSSVL